MSVTNGREERRSAIGVPPKVVLAMPAAVHIIQCLVGALTECERRARLAREGEG